MSASVRNFDWRDIPAIYRLRQSIVYLDNALLLTRGALPVQGAFFSYLAPSMGVFTCVAEAKEDKATPVIGQFIHLLNSQFAHLTFLMPENALDTAGFPAALDYMAARSGGRGALRLLADVDEHSPVFEALRGVGFAIFSRQRIWRLAGKLAAQPEDVTWRPAFSQDQPQIRALYNNVVPGLVQQVEPFMTERLRGMVSIQNGEVVAYVEIRQGHRGIWLQPFVHPDAAIVPERLAALLKKIPNILSLPVYVCVRSYQSWLETAIQELAGEAGSMQAVMVKHLAVAQKATKPFAVPALEGKQPEVTAPFARSERIK